MVDNRNAGTASTYYSMPAVIWVNRRALCPLAMPEKVRHVAKVAKALEG